VTQVGSIHCIDPESLERAIADGTVTEDMRSHLGVCPACRELEQMMRENIAFMGDVAVKLGSDVLALPPRAIVDPTMLPGYELVREIARGGQGVVYEAVQIETKRRVAVKVIETGDADGRTRRRVEREAELAASLRHPNIVSLFQRTVLSDGRQALAMEYVEGVAIDEWARAVDAAAPQTREGERTALRVKLRAMATVCDALQHAHVNGVIHRDLKPANVLVTNNGVPRVVDFGIARRVTSETRITRTGAFAGTLAYASPEQVSGHPGAVDIRSDVYSLGLILYEVLTGRRPYDTAGSLSGAIANITRNPPAPLGKLKPGDQAAGDELESIIERALAKERNERYQSAAALRNDIENYLAGRPVEARHHSTVYLLKKLAWRHRVAFLATTAGVTLLAAFAGVMAWTSSRLSNQRSLLQSSLASSTIERGRLMAVNGDSGRAEEMIRPELIRVLGSTADDRACFEGTPEQVQALWALFELYSRHPVMSQVPVTAGIEVLRWSDDNASVHLVRSDGLQEVRRVSDGALVRQIKPRESEPGGALMLDSTRRRAMVTRGGRALVIGAQGDSFELVVPDLRGRVYDFSPDGSRFLVLTAEGELSLWRTEPAERLMTLTDRLAGQTRPRFSVDGRWVCAGVADDIQLWRSSDGVLDRSIKVPAAVWSSAIRAAVTTVRVRPNSEQIAAGFHSSVLLYPGGDRPPMELSAHRGFVGWMEYSADGSVLMTQGNERNFKTWDPDSGHLLCSFEQVAAPRGSPSLSPDGSMIACCDDRDALNIYESRPRKWLTRLSGAENSVHCVRFSPGGGMLATVAADGKLRLWDVASRRLVKEVPNPERLPLEAVCFNPKGGSVFVAGQGGKVFRCSESGTDGLELVTDAPERVTWLGCSPDGKWLAMAGGSPVIEVVDIAHPEAKRSLAGHSQRAIEGVFHPKGTTLFTVGGDGLCIAWDFPSGREKFRTVVSKSPTRALALSPDSKVVAAGSDDWKIRLLDASTGVVRATLSGAKQHVFGLVFHPSGNLLFSSSRDSVIQVWDVRAGREIAVLEGHDGLVLSLAVSPDGLRLASGSSDRTAGIWDLGYYRKHVAGGSPMWTKGPLLAGVPAGR
jgi:serine/threonine protein kinase